MCKSFQILLLAVLLFAVTLFSEALTIADETTALPGRGKYFGLRIELTKKQLDELKRLSGLGGLGTPLTNGEARQGSVRSASDLEKFTATVDALYSKYEVSLLPDSQLPEVDFDKKMVVFVIVRAGQSDFQFDKAGLSEDGKRLIVDWTRDRHYYKRDKRAIRVKASEAVLPKGPRVIARSPSVSSGSGGPRPDLIGHALVLDRFDGKIQFQEWIYTVPVD